MKEIQQHIYYTSVSMYDTLKICPSLKILCERIVRRRGISGVALVCLLLLFWLLTPCWLALDGLHKTHKYLLTNKGQQVNILHITW